MPRRGRERDALPSIEVIGGARAEESVQEVEVGGDGRGGRWWRLGLAAAVVGIGLVALLGSGSDGDGERSASSSTTRSTVRRSTTSSTTTTLPPPSGPVLPVQTGSFLLMTGPTGSTHLLDLDTGAYRAVDSRIGDLRGLGLVLPVRGGVVVSDGAGGTQYLPVISGGAPVPLSDGDLVLSSGSPDSVWVGETPDGPPSEVHLVDLQGRTLATRRFTPAEYLTATTEGPVFSDGGWTYVGTSGVPRSLGAGRPLGSSADQVAIRECGERASCAVVLVDVRSGARLVLEALRGAPGEPHLTIEFTPDGDLVAIEQRPDDTARLRWLDPEGRLLGEGVGSLVSPAGLYGEPTFLPARQGLLLATGARQITWMRPAGGALVTERFPIHPPHAVEQLVLISP